MLNKILILLFALPLIVGITATNGLRSHGQSPKAGKQDSATPVQEGVMTEKQREHSKLYRGYTGAGKKLRDLAEEEIKKGNSDDIGIAALPGIPELRPHVTPFREVLTELACGADAIVIGIVKDRSSQLTESGTFIFTDYELTVEEVLKDNTSGHIEPTTSLTVTRPGGRILLEGHVISAIDKSAKPFEIGGRYILFLQYLPTTGSYRTPGINGSFQIKDEKLVALTDSVTSSAEFLGGKNALSFMTEVRSAVAFCK